MDRQTNGREDQRRDIDREVRRAVDVRERFVREMDAFDASLDALRRPRWHLPPDEHPGPSVPIPHDQEGAS